MKTRTILTFAIASVLGVTGGVTAQQPTAAPTGFAAPTVAAPTPAPTAVPVAPAVASPVAPAPVVAAPAVPLATPVATPVSSPVINLGNMTDTTADMADDDLLRTRARISSRRDLVKAQQELDQAILSRQQAQVEGQIKLEQLRLSAANGGKKPEEIQAQQKAAASTAAVAAVVLAPQPVVRSIYGFGDNAYAEIYVGNNKILANRGTVLDGGERVVDFTPNGVVLVDKRGRRQTLRVRGSAGTVAPVSAQGSVAPGLPPLP